METICFPNGTTVPALGQGMWMMAERTGQRPQEIAALSEGINLGMTVIDTAEMYVDGEAERLVGKAGTPAHVIDNRGAAEVQFNEEDLAELHKAFPAPTRRERLEML